MRMSLAAYPLLKQEGGAIVNIGSMYSIFGSTIAPGYAASKGGVVALTRSFAASWARDGIRCNAVAPGWIKTNMSRMMRSEEHTSELQSLMRISYAVFCLKKKKKKKRPSEIKNTTHKKILMSI